MNETSKAAIRRFHDIRYVNTYFVGNGIDIGCGPDPLSKFNQQFPLMTGLKPWDLEDGNAQHMGGVEDNTYDFVHSSHCLEHMESPYQAFGNWIRICKPGGHIITTVPEEDMYEQGTWPSNNNADHKYTFTMLKSQSWSPVSINLLEFFHIFKNSIEIIKVEKMDTAYIHGIGKIDQTYHHIAESAIEFIVRKLTDEDKKNKGRLPE